MRKTFTRISLFLVLLVCCIGKVYSQDSIPFSDSSSFFKFLKIQEEIPSFQFRYQIKPEAVSEQVLFDSLLSFSKTEEGIWVSKSFSTYSDWEKAGVDLMKENSSPVIPNFLIYEENSDLQAAQEYISNLWRNKDLFIPETSPEVGEELVLLANLVPYEPLVKYRLHFFSDYKLVIVVSIITFFLVMAIGMIIFMLIIKANHSRVEALKKEYESIVIGPISEILFEKSLEEINELTEADIHHLFPEKYFKRKLFKQVLIENIISLNKKMKGDFKEKLKALFKKFGLDKISISKLKNKRWDIVTNGLVHINEMDLVEALPKVRDLTDSPNFYIRSQAISTVLNLSEKTDLSKIKQQSFPLSRWQQMNYLRIIKYLHIQKSLDLTPLFEGKNQTVRLFGYKLVRLLGRIELVEKLAEMAPKVPDIEKIEILKTYEVIGINSEAFFINQCLRSDNEDLLNVAIRVSGTIGDQASAHILIELLDENPDFNTRKLLLDNLKKLDETMYNEYVVKNQDEDTIRINTHLLDPLLQHV
ncbi:hypothetical protein JYB64_06965 [Algoriphagus aestuarii]|nr:hypothetical protein [Algoriphagus aestuarii]